MSKVRVLMVTALAGMMACGGGGGDGGGGTGPQVFTTFSVDPSSVTVLVNGTQTLSATAKDQNNAAMGGLSVSYSSNNTAVATVSQSGVVTGVSVGTAKVTATGTIGSVSKTSDVNVSVTVPGATASVTATASDQFNPSTATITKGGTVTWTFAALHNVIFDGGAGVPTNIGDTSSGSVSRTFTTSGSFPYHCTIHPGMNGTVVVQ